MTEIKIHGRNYLVDVSHVTGFCTSASVSIEGRKFESRDYPYQFTANAISGLLSRVKDVYPEAEVVS